MDSVKLDHDFNYATQLTRLLLLPLGLWPTKSKEHQRFVRPIAIVICLSIMLLAIIPLCFYIVLIVKDSKIRLKLFGPLSFGLVGLFKYVVMILKKNQLTECIWNMSLDWQQLRNIKERKIMRANVKTSRLLIIVCVIFTYGGGLLYVTVLPLSYPGYFVSFSPQVRPIYDFVFTLHCINGFVSYAVSCGVLSIAILCIMHICSQITITRTMLDKLVENFDYNLLGEIVRQHLRLLKFASKLEEILNGICLFEIFGSVCIICFLGYYLITEYENRETIVLITYLLLIMSFIFNIFILCYIGEILTEQCESIGKAAYMMDWYRLPQKDAKNIIFFITITQRPVYLTVGKILNLSILTFANVIQTSASYLNILRSMIARVDGS